MITSRVAARLVAISQQESPPPTSDEWLEQRLLGYFDARPCARSLRFSRLRWFGDVEEIR